MTKIFTAILLCFAVLASSPATAYSTKKPIKEAEKPRTNLGSPMPEKTSRLVMTDMLVPTECLDYGRTICAQLQAGSTRKLQYGVHCIMLKNKTPNNMFVPLRSDFEIEQFLLNASAEQITRSPCPDDKKAD